MSAREAGRERQDPPRGEPAAPLPLTREEVEAKAEGKAGARSVTARIRAHRESSAGIGRVRSGAARPVSVGKAEMAEAGREGAPTRALRKRIERSEVPASGHRAPEPAKDAPDRKPGGES